jgi:hypothetical protein
MTAGRGEFQFHLAAIPITTGSLAQTTLRQLIDDTRHRAAVVTDLVGNVLGIDRYAITERCKKLVLHKGESKRLEHRFCDAHDQ